MRIEDSHLSYSCLLVTLLLPLLHLELANCLEVFSHSHLLLQDIGCLIHQHLALVTNQWVLPELHSQLQELLWEVGR